MSRAMKFMPTRSGTAHQCGRRTKEFRRCSELWIIGIDSKPRVFADVWVRSIRSAGAANRIRTCDPVITNDVLYQLSYCGGPCGAFSKRG